MTDQRIPTDAECERLAYEAEHDPEIRRKVREAAEELEREGKIVRDGDGYRVARGWRPPAEGRRPSRQAAHES